MTKPNCENIAVTNLVQQGFTTYAPRFKQLCPDKKILIKPLFPRYIFALIDDMWWCIRSTRGVSHLLMGNNGPKQVPLTIINTFKSSEDGEGFIVMHPKGVMERFHKGDKIRTTEGPLVDKILIYEGMTSRDRVRVLVSMLGREVPVTLPERTLVAA